MMRRISKKMSGGQAKIAAKAPPPNKIDAKDFAVLRAEKAKGRGQGLQDEKLKPGKVTKAALGVLAAGLGARNKMKDKKMAPMAMGAVGAGSMKMALIKRLLGKKTGGVMKAKMGKAVDYRKFLDGLKKATNEVNYNRAVMKRKAMEKAKDIGGFAKRAAKASRYGKIAAGVAGAALVGKAALEKMYEKRTGKKPFTKRPAKKMGGGMMQRPMGYDEGGLQAKVDRDATIRKARSSINKISSKEPKRNMLKGMSENSLLYAIANAVKDKDRLTKRDLQTVMSTNTGFKSAIKKLQSQKRMGGGMMQRPIMGGYKTGKMIKAKGCKLGRSKPTKMY